MAAIENLARRASIIQTTVVQHAVMSGRAFRMLQAPAGCASSLLLVPEEIKRLFRPFSQANERIARRYGGAGLGLAFVKRIAEAMGGDLEVASTPGGGSRFQLTVTVDKPR